MKAQKALTPRTPSNSKIFSFNIRGVDRVTAKSARITVFSGYEDGRQVRKAKTVKFPEKIANNEAKLREWLIKELARFEVQCRRQEVGDLKHTLKSWSEIWLNEYIKPYRKIGTYDSHKANFDLHINTELGKIKLENLTPVKLQAFVNRLAVKESTRGSRLSPVTVGNVRRTLSACLECAVKQQLMVSNPAKRVQWPSEQRRQGHALTPDEYKAICAEINKLSTMWQACLYLLISTGMRRGEAIGLDWSNVDLQNKSLRIVQNAVVRKGKISDGEPSDRVLLQTPKTRAGIRSNYINDHVAGLLQQLRKEQLEYNLNHGIPWTDDAPVFLSDLIVPGSPRTRICPDSVTFRFSKICDDAGVKGVHLHDLRHSFVSAAIHAGAAVTDIARQVGHASTDVTLRVYSHAFGNELDSSKRLSDLVTGTYDNTAKASM